eukprot:CAMPEP_0202847154 /NCGR_PEP_ID=MMETSP1389-20130828/74721_1 /ASSEMBLY_ACC=CAM_ASM_000865 /TAXON_ID=302021 /ORGANISM="Rhodomonas sp., Strain CCMP768" /LENGTH=42 /DNA_ID= /DNA_START= /DNA_END= /DNA_ORIENTATION=
MKEEHCDVRIRVEATDSCLLAGLGVALGDLDVLHSLQGGRQA